MRPTIRVSHRMCATQVVCVCLVVAAPPFAVTQIFVDDEAGLGGVMASASGQDADGADRHLPDGGGRRRARGRSPRDAGAEYVPWHQHPDVRSRSHRSSLPRSRSRTTAAGTGRAFWSTASTMRRSRRFPRTASVSWTRPSVSCPTGRSDTSSTTKTRVRRRQFSADMFAELRSLAKFFENAGCRLRKSSFTPWEGKPLRCYRDFCAQRS